MERVKNVLKAIVGKAPDTLAQKCEHMLSNVSKEFSTILRQKLKEEDKLEKHIYKLLQVNGFPAELRVSKIVQIKRDKLVAKRVITCSEMLIPKAEGLFFDGARGRDWNNVNKEAIGTLAYISDRMHEAKELGVLLCFLRKVFNGKNSLGKTTKFVSNEVKNWFAPLRVLEFQKNVILADIAARNGGLENLVVQLPQDYADHLPGVLANLHAI